MPDSAFLDTGVVFGYCVPLDQHHVRCDQYIENFGGNLYITATVDDEFSRMKQSRIQELSTAVLDHVRTLKQSDLDDSLGPMDINHIKNRVLSSSNEAYQFLYWYYDDEVSQFVQRDQLIKNIRELARDIESRSLQRKRNLDTLIEEWRPQDSYPEVQSTLSMIHHQDLQLCIQAHDLACHNDGGVEFATANPQDFVDDGRMDVILEVTEIDNIRNLAIRG